MLAAVGPFVAHQFQDLEELLKVEVLLASNDVEHLLEMVLLVSLVGRSNVSGDVQGGPIRLLDQSHIQFVGLE